MSPDHIEDGLLHPGLAVVVGEDVHVDQDVVRPSHQAAQHSLQVHAHLGDWMRLKVFL